MFKKPRFLPDLVMNLPDGEKTLAMCAFTKYIHTLQQRDAQKDGQTEMVKQYRALQASAR